MSSSVITHAPPHPPKPRADWAYFFDIDGTLVDLAATPDEVTLDRELRRSLEGLYQSTGGAVALMSGRALVDIDRLFTTVTFPAAGQHGAERRDAHGRLVLQPVTSSELETAHDLVLTAIQDKPGLLLEFKGLSLALHYRQTPRHAGFVHRTMRAALARLGREYCIQTGKSVVELKPCGKDKGRAVVDFMREPPFTGRIPVFVGDDDTDEFGFETVNSLGGLSIKVGSGDTAARWRLADVKAVQLWLHSI